MSSLTGSAMQLKVDVVNLGLLLACIQCVGKFLNYYIYVRLTFLMIRVHMHEVKNTCTYRTKPSAIYNSKHVFTCCPLSSLYLGLKSAYAVQAKWPIRPELIPVSVT